MVDKSRRMFLKYMLWLGGGLAAMAAIPRSLASTMGGSALTELFQATNGALVGPGSIWDPKVVECDYYGCSFVQYQPEAIVELVASPWSSIFLNDAVSGSSMAGAIGVRTNNPVDDKNYELKQNFEAHVWGVNDDMREGLCIGASCIMCKESEVDSQGQGSDSDSKLAEELSASSQSKFGCPPVNIAGSSVASEFMSNVNTDMPLLYASELDEMNWRAGCRDLAVAFSTEPVVVPWCAEDGIVQDSATGLSVFGGSGSSSGSTSGGYVGSAIGGSEDGFFSDLGKKGQALKDALNATPIGELCVGSWGPMWPRQMASVGAGQSVGMALAAYRALRIAHTSWGTFKPIVNTRCILQPFYPEGVGTGLNLATAKGFRIGEAPPIVDSIMSPFLQGQTWANDGRMGFVLWVPTGCWKSYSEIESCYES